MDREEPGGLSPKGRKESETTEVTQHAYRYFIVGLTEDTSVPEVFTSL